ncbi:MAG: PBP1A family penicillin-binding protein [Chloroherpetonaceae bacterium]|nr:PBP1A family penicillin-binding protein [Chloroherpetonaceae bacterium]MDW8438245.1 PBP1A family penicillin-binding protein [Chloroherpetonaceae bacterium]
MSEHQPSKDDAYTSDLRERYLNDPNYRHRVAARRKWRERIYWASMGALAFVALATIGLLAHWATDLPSLEQLENPKPQLATEVYSYDGVLLTKFFMENRTAVPLDSISKNLVHALIATEDVEFYDHWGLNLRRFVVAMIENVGRILSGKRAHGASTITQQLAKNLWLTPARHIKRKAQELMIAIQIERAYTKNEILELYLNAVYFGKGAYGAEAAAWTYFAKPASKLTVGESATLIGVLKNPEDYNPVDNPDVAKKRRNVILDLMVKANFLSPEQAMKEKLKPIELKFTPVTDRGIAPYFTEYVRQRLKKEAAKFKFDVFRDGLIVTTTLDSRMQAYAEKAYAEHLKFLQEKVNKSWSWKTKKGEELKATFIRESERYKKLVESGASEKEAFARLKDDKAWLDSLLAEKLVVQAALVAIEPSTGYVKAWVGGRDFEKYKLDHVWQARRQPGSTFKPFVYTVAIDKGIPPSYQVLNQPIAIQTTINSKDRVWTPKNADDEIGGFTSLRDALKNSLNYVTIRLAQQHVPPEEIIRYAKKLGISSPLRQDLSLALGTSEVTPLELAAAYGTFANNGVHVEPIAILRIDDKFGSTIASYKTDRWEAISQETNYVMVSMLKSVMDGGTGSAARFRYNFRLEAGGKTGTTQNQADAWFMGFTPELVCGVWTGFDDMRIHYTSMEFGQGSRAALPIWAMFMKACYDDKSLGLQPRYFLKPAGVQGRLVSKSSGRFAPASAPDAYVEYFTNASLKRYASLYGSIDTLSLPPTIPNLKKRGEGQF